MGGYTCYTVQLLLLVITTTLQMWLLLLLLLPLAATCIGDGDGCYLPRCCGDGDCSLLITTLNYDYD